MAEHYFALSKEDQGEVLEQAREKTGRPAPARKGCVGRPSACSSEITGPSS